MFQRFGNGAWNNRKLISFRTFKNIFTISLGLFQNILNSFKQVRMENNIYTCLEIIGKNVSAHKVSGLPFRPIISFNT